MVIAHADRLEEPDGIATMLRGLGGDVVALPLWSHEGKLEQRTDPIQTLVLDLGERAEEAALALRTIKVKGHRRQVPILLAVAAGHLGRLDPAAGFDDFISTPCTPTELYVRIRHVEWYNSEFLNEERLKIGNLLIDRAAHAVYVDGRDVVLTAKEYALLVTLASERGRMLSRDALLQRVWGDMYDGGPRTVDIHVRRLRSKLGTACCIETLRGSGYRWPRLEGGG